MPYFSLSGHQGSSFSMLFRATDCAGVPLNLSGYSIRSTVKEKYSSSTGVSSFNSVISNPGSGICSITMSSSGTSALYPAIYLYDIEVYDPLETDTMKLLWGNFLLAPQAST